MTAKDLIEKYITFFEKRGHKQIPNASLVPENDPTTLFTSSGMQPLVPYLLGEPHPLGKRLVNVQNSFRAQDIDEVGDNRHTTFFRMLGNWSLGDYFKSEQLPWFFEFLTEELGIDPKKLYISVFDGDESFRVRHKDTEQKLLPDVESYNIWAKLFQIEDNEIAKKEKIRYYGAEKNWWSRAGTPDKMPVGEIGGPDSEVFYDFGEDLRIHENSSYKNQQCHPNCDCGRFLEIGNSVFMQYKKINETTFEELPNKNVDFGGGLERLIAAVENQNDIFKTSLFYPIIQSIEKNTNKNYEKYPREMRVITDHFTASLFIADANIEPSNKDQGYILRRLIRRGFDSFYRLEGENITPIIETIVDQYKETDSELIVSFEKIKNIILEEQQNYMQTINKAVKNIRIVDSTHPEDIPRVKISGDEIKGVNMISAEDAFNLYQSHGLSPSQIKSLGYEFDEQKFAKKMEEHQKISRAGAGQRFAGGLADHSEKTIMGHTATHLLHKALRDILGEQVHQIGSNINSERLRFDYTFDRKMTEDEVKKIEEIINQKIKENLPVRFEIMDIETARKTGAIGLFGEKYGDKVKVYFIGGSKDKPDEFYSAEFCGGPHVDNIGKLGSFKILKDEGLGKGKRRVYARIGE